MKGFIKTLFIFVFAFIFAYLFFQYKSNLKTKKEYLKNRDIVVVNRGKVKNSSFNIGREFVHNTVFTQYLRYYSDIFKSKWAKSLYNFEITNLTDTIQKIYVFSKMDKFSEPSLRVVSLLPMQKDTCGITPKIDYLSLSKLKENEFANLQVLVVSFFGDTILKKSEKIEFYSNNIAVFSLTNIFGKIDLRKYLSVWITPNISEFNDVLRDAVEYSPFKSFYGYQKISGYSNKDLVNFQVKAIFKALKKVDIAYVNSPVTYVGSQNIKSPKEVLRYKSANCIEGVLLFASLLETIGIEPLVVLIDGHAFLGWKLSQNSNSVDFLETTYIWSVNDYNFEQAQKVAYQEYEDNRNSLTIIDVINSRKMGILPGYF